MCQLRKSWHSRKVVNIAGGSKDIGANIIQFEENDHDNSKWRLEDAGDGYFYLISKHSRKFLQVDNGDWGNSAKVTQGEEEKLDHQKWKFVVNTNS